MEERITASVSGSRDVNMFAELSSANHVLLENAAEKRDGYFYETMSCIIVAAFKYESFLNHIGTRLFSYWHDLEKLPHRKKLSIIAHHLDVTIDDGCRPFQTLKRLMDTRNDLAHGKPQELKETQIRRTGTREELRRTKPLTEWEDWCNYEFAQRACEDTEKIAELLWNAAGYDSYELRRRGHSYSISNVTEST